MAKVLITGASGFIGRHLVDALRENGHRLICLTRSDVEAPTGYNNVRWVKADLLLPDSYREEINKADYVFHLAGVINARQADQYYKGNVESTKRLLEACGSSETEMAGFILMSSIAAMGPGDTDTPRMEFDECNPNSEYGRSKLQAEMAAGAFRVMFPVTILRPSFVYGIGDLRGAHFLRSVISARSLPFLNAIKTFSICDVRDVVRACLLSMDNRKLRGGVYLISDGEVYTWKEIFNVVLGTLVNLKRAVSKKNKDVYERMFRSVSEVYSRIKLIHRGGQYWGCDITRAREDLGFNPEIDLTAGARETIAHYLKNGLLEI